MRLLPYTYAGALVMCEPTNYRRVLAQTVGVNANREKSGDDRDEDRRTGEEGGEGGGGR